MAELISHEGIVECVTEGRVRVRIVQTAACAGCKAKSMCTAGETMVKEIDATPLEPMQAGDEVIVEVAKKLGWKAVLLAFVLPFSIMLLCVGILPKWIDSEAIVGTIAIVAVAPYYVVLHLFSGKFEQEYQFTARKQ